MMTLVSYDVSTVDVAGRKRLRKVAKECVNYGQRVQNSVFEGEISDANYAKLMIDLSKVMDKTEDSVIIYNLRTTKYYNREIVGKERGDIGYII